MTVGSGKLVWRQEQIGVAAIDVSGKVGLERASETYATPSMKRILFCGLHQW